MKQFIGIAVVVIVVGVALGRVSLVATEVQKSAPTPPPVTVSIPEPVEVLPVPQETLATVEAPAAPSPVETVVQPFYSVVLQGSKPGSELIDLVGFEHVPTVLALNRLDDKNLRVGTSITIPRSFDDPSLLIFMPERIEAAKDIPKLVVVAQSVQAVGFYEYGTLVRSGPVSSGKKSTPTKSDLYFANWKGKEVISTFSDEWILKWNVNIENKEGIALHQYGLPGYPASHSCVRLSEDDAMWLYEWVLQWVLADDGKTELARGTPVIVYGAYDFAKKAPWKQLPTDPTATTIESAEIEAIVEGYVPAIMRAQDTRNKLLTL